MGRRSHRKIKQRKRMVLPHPRSNKGDTGSGKVKESRIEVSPNCKPLWWSVHQEALKQTSPSARFEMYDIIDSYPRVRGQSRPFDNPRFLHEDFFQYTWDLYKRVHQRINHI
ncbi:Hypothetical protein ZAZAV_526 [Cedratvirus Zaza IHUMI]|uniref:Uncharacterized protein n=1 Tax=Cedratvirus Zaza IHUMI TaxID=2126979 RepID=A0A2R8FFW1_9VIRU|nr:Hypothetical protein ZAZAV_526 [Cedratvirus Zaza IHUMI]